MFRQLGQAYNTLCQKLGQAYNTLCTLRRLCHLFIFSMEAPQVRPLERLPKNNQPTGEFQSAMFSLSFGCEVGFWALAAYGRP